MRPWPITRYLRQKNRLRFLLRVKPSQSIGSEKLHEHICKSTWLPARLQISLEHRIFLEHRNLEGHEFIGIMFCAEPFFLSARESPQVCTFDGTNRFAALEASPLALDRALRYMRMGHDASFFVRAETLVSGQTGSRSPGPRAGQALRSAAAESIPREPLPRLLRRRGSPGGDRGCAGWLLRQA